jgi:alanine racemase
VCAVVKADAYGHGARAVAAPLLEAGASSLGVALVDEGIELREDGIEAPILLLSEAPVTALDDAIAAGLTLTVGSPRGANDVVAARARASSPVAVHVKVDTGMHRQGVAPTQLAAVAQLLRSGDVGLSGAWTHLPVADGDDEESRTFTLAQLEAFAASVATARTELQQGATLHAANTAAAMWSPHARLDLVRIGLGLYGYLPHPAMHEVLRSAGLEQLRPVLSVHARVSAVRDLERGARPSYGRRRALQHDARVATVPLGYADGVPRAMLEGGEVLIRGRRRPLAGVVTMDQLVVDCGDDDVEVGDEVVLIGTQGDETITADDWATTLDTISWEVLCGFKARIPRQLVD